MKRTELRRKTPMKRTAFRKPLGQYQWAGVLERELAGTRRAANQTKWVHACRAAYDAPWVCSAYLDQQDPDVGPCEGQTECDHIFPKSAGGVYEVGNGGPLCSQHHRMKTDSQLQWRFEWLKPYQIRWLAANGWVAWDNDGSPYGLGWRHFKPLTEDQLAECLRLGGLPQLTR